MKNLLFLTCLLFLISCKSTQKNLRSSKKFVPLDKTTVSGFMDGYSIKLPDSWYSYLGYHGIYHSPKRKIIKSKKHQLATININVFRDYENKITFFNKKTNDRFISTIYNPKKKHIKSEKYDEAILLKYETIHDGDNHTNLSLLYYL